ncbi:hypothetical protein ABIB38_004095 [Massilia sp. UYP11]
MPRKRPLHTLLKRFSKSNSNAELTVFGDSIHVPQLLTIQIEYLRLQKKMHRHMLILLE